MTTPSEVIAEQPPQPATVVIATFAQLESTIAKYIVDSRTGDTMSYRDTAALSTEDAARSSAQKLWREFEEAGLVAGVSTMTADEIASPAVEVVPPPGCVAVRLNSDLLIADEDIVAGQFCVISDKGHIRVATGEEVNLQPDAADPQQALPLDLPVVTTLVAEDLPYSANAMPMGHQDVADDDGSYAAHKARKAAESPAASNIDPDVAALFGL